MESSVCPQLLLCLPMGSQYSANRQQAGMTCLPLGGAFACSEGYVALGDLLSLSLFLELSVSISSAPGCLKPNQDACF